MHSVSRCQTYITDADETRVGNLKMNGSLESLKKIVANLNDAELNPNAGAPSYLTRVYEPDRLSPPLQRS